MGNFQIAETHSFQDNLAADCRHQAQAVYAKILSKAFPRLKQNPYRGSNIKKLKDRIPETWRYRLGDYRIFCYIDGPHKVVILFAFSHRKDAY